MLPLSQRLTAPPLVLPSGPEGVAWRPATVADLPAILACEHAMNRVDHPHYLTNAGELADDFPQSWTDLARDSLLALDADGAVLAWGLVELSQGQESQVRTLLNGGVHPDARGRGLGRRLLAWQEARALGLLAASDRALPGTLVLWVDERAASTLALARRRGFRVGRYYLEKRRDLPAPLEPRPLQGYEVGAFSPERREEVRLARNDAFRDHWGSQPVVPEAWETFVARSIFRPDLSFLAVAPDGEVAGFVLAEVDEGDFEGQGFTSAYIDLVGVRRAHRGRGIAPALLTRTLEATRDAGLQKAVLDVDSASLTGATGLYEALGFTAANRSVALRKEV